MKPSSFAIRTALLAALGTVLVTPVVRADEDGNFEVRLRGTYLDMADKSDAIPSLKVPQDAIHVNDKWIPELDLEYFFTRHWSSELVLTYPQSQTVTVERSVLGGPADIGTFKHLPPFLMAKYNFLPDQVFQPYVGAGVNLTLISNVDLNVPTVGPLKLNSSSVGPALQAGFDWRVARHWFVNADVKWAKLGSDVDAGGTRVSHVNLDPLVLSVGIGYRFGGGSAAAAPVAAAAAVTPPPAPPAPTPAPVVTPAPAPAPVAAQPTPPPAPALRQEQVLKGVNFQTNSATLRPESESILNGVATTINGCQCSRVEIRGYTDSTGNPAYNQKLSEQRAESVQQYLEAHGVAPNILHAQGFGEENPIASNKTAAGRAQNRRVTIEYSAPVTR